VNRGDDQVNRHQFELPLGSGIDRGMTIVQCATLGVNDHEGGWACP
jgi:hypothetical protein